MTLCDNLTSNEEKEKLVKALIEVDRPQTFVPMKPAFKVDVLMNKHHNASQLHHFVGLRSWLIFALFDVDVQWMQYRADQWNLHSEFKRFYELVNSIVCVNDCAERNVKNVTEHAEYSKDPERRDRVVMVTNFHKEMVDFSNMTKEQLSRL